MESCNECGKILTEDNEYTNIEHTDVYFCDHCLGKPYQPERSKREDLSFKQLADEFYNSCVTKDLLQNWEEENGAVKVLDEFANWLDSRCGALNSIEI